MRNSQDLNISRTFEKEKLSIIFFWDQKIDLCDEQIYTILKLFQIKDRTCFR